MYEGNRKAWDLLIIDMMYIYFGLVIQCNYNANEACKVIIEKYEFPVLKQESLNEVANICNNCRIKYSIQDPDIFSQ